MVSYMVFLCFPYGFLMVFQSCFYGVLMDFPMAFLWNISNGFSYGFSYKFLMDFPMVFLWCSYKFLEMFLSFSHSKLHFPWDFSARLRQETPGRRSLIGSDGRRLRQGCLGWCRRGQWMELPEIYLFLIHEKTVVIFHYFFYDVPWWSMIFHDGPWFSMFFHDFPTMFDDCSWFSYDVRWFSMMFSEFPRFWQVFTPKTRPFWGLISQMDHHLGCVSFWIKIPCS